VDDVNRIRVRDLTVTVDPIQRIKDIVFDSVNLSPSATSYVVQSGVLLVDHSYIFDVQLDDLRGTSGPPEARSETFTQESFNTPEPSSLLALGGGAVALFALRARRRR
jgi:hypothetical protein